MAPFEEIPVNSYSYCFVENDVLIFLYFSNPDEPLIICNECGKTYKTKNQFRMHQVSSHLEKTHQCSDCGKKFAFAVSHDCLTAINIDLIHGLHRINGPFLSIMVVTLPPYGFQQRVYESKQKLKLTTTLEMSFNELGGIPTPFRSPATSFRTHIGYRSSKEEPCKVFIDEFTVNFLTPLGWFFF